MSLPLHHQVARFPPYARQTLFSMLVLSLTTAPFSAMMAYATFTMVKTFHAPGWVPLLAATANVGNLLAMLVANRVQRSDKIAWIVWPNLAASSLMIGVLFIKPHMAVCFALLIMLAQVIRTPITSAQSVLYRTHFPAPVRSYATSLQICLLLIGMAGYSYVAGRLLERSESWLGPVYALTGLIGIAGSWHFSGLRRLRLPAAAQPAPATPTPNYSLRDQVELLRRDRGFFQFQFATMVFGLGNLAMGTIFPIFLARELAASHAQALIAINEIPMITSVLMLPLWGLMLDRKNPLLIWVWINSIWSLTGLVYFFTHALPTIYWTVFLAGLVQGGGILIWYLGINYYSHARNVALYMGVHQTLTGIRGIAAPFIAGVVAQWIGCRRSMLIWFVLMAGGSLMMYLEFRRERRLGLARSFQECEEVAETTGTAEIPETAKVG